jgi:lipoyl(octanoyl) transferase
MGVRISHGVTRHGFALNITNDLSPFAAILPCGLTGVGVTSALRETGHSPRLQDVAAAVLVAFQEVFALRLQRENSLEFLAMVDTALKTPRAPQVPGTGSLDRALVH